MFARALIACLLAAAVAGCAGGPSIPGASTGTVTGHVELRACGGAYRVEQTGCPTQPYADLTLTFTPVSSAGSAQAVTTDSNGSYRVDLKPGTYTVQASRATNRAGTLGGPRQVVVTAGTTVTADFVYTIQML
jgi:hypothetical protein